MKRLMFRAAALGLGSLGFGCSTPYDLTISDINEEGPQRPAVIALSDPQLYTRERLLNDRDDEVAFLRAQLAQVDKLDYTPRLKRDIDTLLEVMAVLSLKFDPVAGADIRQQAEINALRNEAEIEKLRILLEDLKTKTAEDLGEGGKVEDGAEDGTADSTLTSDSVDETINKINGLLANLDNALKARLGGESSRPGLRANSVSDATPSELLRDKVAYRNEVQAALEQAQLDDRHDMVGNALYRLQFKATIFPGPHKDKYAVTRLTILPPVFTNDAAVSQLYLDWLAYVAKELNPGSEAGIADALDDRSDFYRTLGPATGMYSVARLPLHSQGDARCPGADELVTFRDNEIEFKPFTDVSSTCPVFLIATHTAVEQYQVSTVADDNASELLAKAFDMLTLHVRSNNNLYITDDPAERETCSLLYYNHQPTMPSLRDSVVDGQNKLTALLATTSAETDWSGEDVRLIVGWARNIVSLAPSYALAVERARDSIPDQDHKALDAYLENLGRLQASATGLLAAVRQVGIAQKKLQDKGNEGPNEQADIPSAEFPTAGSSRTAEPTKAVPPICAEYNEVVGRIWVPHPFYWSVAHRDKEHALDPSEEQNSGARFTQGDAYAYSTAPTEFAQRVSTVASATQAMDLIASISALIPSANVGINAAGQIRQIATGRVDAMESTPLIVGFSNSGAANLAQRQFLANRGEPSFGWVFGPKVTVDTQKNQLALTQVLVNHPVTADISVPGWWRKVRLRVETSWANGFDDAIFDQAPTQRPVEPIKPSKPARNAPSQEWFAYYGKMVTYWTDLQSYEAWHQGYERGVFSYVMEVPLQSNPETFEQLTEYIAAQVWGAQQKKPVIADFFPKTIPACEQVTLLIAGPDLWRGRRVYLNGVPAMDTKIMPDMRGLEATFRLPASAVGPGQIVVWTQLGMQKTEIGGGPEVIASDKCEGAAANIPLATVSGPAVVIPDGKVSLVIPQDSANTDHNAFLQLHKQGESFRVEIDKASVEHDGRTFTVKMPAAASFKAPDTLNPGDTFVLTLRAITPDETRIIAQSPVLYYYPAAIETVLAKDAKLDWEDGATTGTVAVELPKAFTKAYGDGISASIDGFFKGSDKATPVNSEDMSINADKLTIPFAVVEGLKTPNNQLSVTLTVNGRKLPAFAAKRS